MAFPNRKWRQWIKECLIDFPDRLISDTDALPRADSGSSFSAKTDLALRIFEIWVLWPGSRRDPAPESSTSGFRRFWRTLQGDAHFQFFRFWFFKATFWQFFFSHFYSKKHVHCYLSLFPLFPSFHFEMRSRISKWGSLSICPSFVSWLVSVTLSNNY